MDAPQPNRLAAEAYYRAEGYKIVSMVGTAALPTLVVMLLFSGDYSGRSWQAVASVAVTTASSHLMRRRWSARARWLHHTPQWWERLNEAPTILPFPRLADGIARVMVRLERAAGSLLAQVTARLRSRRPREDS
ncbi:hypothetical protein OHQ88_33685 (plasmid) [Micromonospora zamorensis]|uniref:hypothetical protein n=1 Tax=Micromonospora zamorensis TaxID=709883 RepID=UPI002E1AF54F